MRATIFKLPHFANEDMVSMARSVHRRIQFRNAVFTYKYNDRTDHMLLYCKCNVCKMILAKYIVDDFGTPMKALFEREEHPCRPWVKR